MAHDPNERLAVVDMGTNTFNLLIAERTGITAESSHPSWTALHRDKIPVKLGAGGIHLGIITQDAEERALNALKSHRATIDEFNPSEVQCYATSAMRDAANGMAIKNRIAHEVGFDVKIIDGNREAELIFKGVQGSMPNLADPVLIMDIGGGSTEFIIGHNNGILWKKSYPLGVSRLLEMFRPSDPGTPEDLVRITNYLDDALSDLRAAVQLHKPMILLGSSGSFDTLRDVIHGGVVQENAGNIYTFNLVELENTLLRLKKMSTTERLNVPGMMPIRAEMMGISSLFIEYILDAFNLEQILQSNYALKEGVVFEWLKANNHG